MRVVIVYESLFGNTRQVAEAIGEGVRQSRPDADIDCLRVAEADPERVGPADLLVVGGPTHMRGMTSGLSRKMGLQAEKKEGEKQEGGEAQPRHEPEEGAEGPGLRDWFHALPKAAKALTPPPSTPAPTSVWQAAPPPPSHADCAATATNSPRNRRVSSSRTPRARCA